MTRRRCCVLVRDDETVGKPSGQFDFELRNDSAAEAKVKVVVDELAAGWRRSGQCKKTAASLDVAPLAGVCVAAGDACRTP